MYLLALISVKIARQRQRFSIIQITSTVKDLNITRETQNSVVANMVVGAH